jgi:hypothetical protein
MTKANAKPKAVTEPKGPKVSIPAFPHKLPMRGAEAVAKARAEWEAKHPIKSLIDNRLVIDLRMRKLSIGMVKSIMADAVESFKLSDLDHMIVLTAGWNNSRTICLRSFGVHPYKDNGTYLAIK